MRAALRLCRGCLRVRVPAGRLVCAQCWSATPGYLQDEMLDAWRTRQASPGYWRMTQRWGLNWLGYRREGRLAELDRPGNSWWAPLPAAWDRHFRVAGRRRGQTKRES